MQLILREDIEKLGSRGQVVKVAAGYARNYLLPKKLAVVATESNKKIVDQERDAHLRRVGPGTDRAGQEGNRPREPQRGHVGDHALRSAVRAIHEDVEAA